MTVDPRYLSEVLRTLYDKGGNLGRAASLLRTIAAAPAQTLTMSWLEARGVDVGRDGGVKRVVDALEVVGVLRPCRDRASWTLPAPSVLLDLSSAVQGAAAAWELAREVMAPEIAVTLPAGPSDIGRALDGVVLNYAKLMTTTDALDAVAARAVGEFTVLTPFLNEAAAPALARVFLLTPARSRTLVIRNFARVRGPLLSVRSALESANVAIRDYLNQDRITASYYETFHAKVALADNDHAYVGSANFLRYARSSVELGVMLNGGSARVVGGLVRAIREIARPCDLGGVSSE